MARQVITEYYDDIDGSPGAETVKFGLYGVDYEIDLGKKSRAKLENALAPFVDKATLVKPQRAARSAGARPAANDREQNQAIRAWAIRKGLDVAERGRIRAEIVEQYHREAGR